MQGVDFSIQSVVPKSPTAAWSHRCVGDAAEGDMLDDDDWGLGNSGGMQLAVPHQLGQLACRLTNVEHDQGHRDERICAGG